jgi:hypothetical protein
MPAIYRQYAVFAATDELYQTYVKGAAAVESFFIAHAPLLSGQKFSIALPSLNWPLEARSSDGGAVRIPKLIIRFASENPDTLSAIQHALEDVHSDDVQLLGFSADPGATDADHWCPLAPDQLAFGTRADARRLIGADALGAPPLSGQGVNVVIVDRGLNEQAIKQRFGAGSYGGGWPFSPQPGDPRPSQVPGQTSVLDAAHGLMLARNILDLAPQAVLWDMPLLPPRISNIPLFLSEAHASYISLLNDLNQRGGTWILVNAWAIFDRESECPPGGYTENLPSPTPLSPFTQEVACAIDKRHDVIFCAGNCGQYCPDQRCGGMDRGPGRSIWGANSFYRVLTVTASRTDGTWIGYSSQGPGQPNLGSPNRPGFSPKPDLCAPSGFCEDLDANLVSAGTSAASGIAAGVVAALRSNWGPQSVKPELLYLILNVTASQPLPGGWNQRFGNGILNVPAAIQMLP